MAHINCVKKIKLNFVDLNCGINEYHNDIVQDAILTPKFLAHWMLIYLFDLGKR